MPQSALMGPQQEMKQEAMGLTLDHAMQVDPSLECQMPLGELSLDRFFKRLMKLRDNLLRCASIGHTEGFGQ